MGTLEFAKCIPHVATSQLDAATKNCTHRARRAIKLSDFVFKFRHKFTLFEWKP